MAIPVRDLYPCSCSCAPLILCGATGNRAASEGLSKTVAYFKSKGVEVVVLTPAQSASIQLKAFDELTMEKTGLFLNYDGKEYA